MIHVLAALLVVAAIAVFVEAWRVRRPKWGVQTRRVWPEEEETWYWSHTVFRARQPAERHASRLNSDPWRQSDARVRRLR